MATLAPPKGKPLAAPDRVFISRVPYLPGLDGMRALAVVAVMIYHANSDWLPGGFLGVEMFFVISGYLITLLLIAERERTYRVSLSEFWIRRARRLLPALFTMMTLLVIWTALFERDALGQLRGDVLGGTFYVSNWYQTWVGLGYTSAGDFAPLRHLWSLAVEEQFYLLWPIVMLLLLGRTGTRRVALVSRWLLLGAVAVTVAVALAYHPGVIGEPSETPAAYWWFGDRPFSKLDTLYLGTFARAGALLLGAAFAMVWRPFAIVRGPLANKGRVFDVLGVVGLVVLAWMCWNVYLVTPGGRADPVLFRGGFFVASVATLLMIAAVTHRRANANRVLGNRLFLWIGTRSYGLYLYHWPIYQIIRDVAGNKLRPHEFALAMVATAAVTELSYRFIEMPIRTRTFLQRMKRLRAHPNPRPRRLVAVGAALASVLAVFAGATMATAELQQNEIAQDLDESEDFRTDLLAVAADEPGATLPATSTTVAPSRPIVPATTLPPTTLPPVTTVATTVPPATSIAPATTVPVTTVPPGTSAPPVVVPASTEPPPPPTTVPPVTQLGVVTDMSTITPLTRPPVTSGLPLVALGDSVMLGAAQELAARGFVVDAVKSRQMVDFLPSLQAIRDAGTFGSVVVVHLGTNGPFSQSTLDQMMAILADVPIVVVLTSKASRGWVGSNNDKTRALPATYPNVTVLDWEVLARACDGRCFYDDGIHLTNSGQQYYTSLIARVLGLP